MVILFEGMTAPYIAVMDTEHDRGILLQYAVILFRRVGEGLYQVEKSLNFYVKREKVSSFTMNFTHITPKFLQNFGITEEQAYEQFNDLVADIDPHDIIFCSHGVHQDALVLEKFGINIMNSPHLCTHELAKSVLDREQNLRLSDICEDAGFCTVLEHNAYTDALETVYALSYLLKIGGSQIYAKIFKY